MLFIVSVIMLSVTMQIVIVQIVILLSVIMLSVAILSVIMPNVIYAECRDAECHLCQVPYADCNYTECHYAEWRGAAETSQAFDYHFICILTRPSVNQNTTQFSNVKTIKFHFILSHFLKLPNQTQVGRQSVTQILSFYFQILVTLNLQFK